MVKSVSSIKRRHVLSYSAVGVAALAGSGTIAAAATAPAPLKVDITLKGRKYEFREENGVSLGDFSSPIGGFTQGCIRVRVTGCPITVHFRPDRNASRVEVVFELGGVFNTTPVNLGPYVATISRGASVLATLDVPAHYWFSRWRWQSEARPVRADIDALIAQNLLPPFDREGILGASYTHATSLASEIGAAACEAEPPPPLIPDLAPSPRTRSVPYTLMGLAGVVPYMPQTGERPDIGLVTEPQAEFICTSRQAVLDVVRAQAEAAGTVPWHIRDENTNAPFNLRSFPDATWYSSTTKGQPYVKAIKTPITVDSAHQPALAYVPYLLTGDPYHLEDLQFQANWNLGSLVPEYRMSIPQARSFAWSLRSLAQCARITPTQVPSWLLPRQYWTGFLTEYRHFFEAEYVSSPKPERARFRTARSIDNSADEGKSAPKGTWTSVWEDDFVTAVLGWVVAMGFPEWQRAFDWKFGSTVARTGKTSGWKRAHATPYRVILRETATSPVASGWAEAWALTQRLGGLTYADPNKWVNDDMTYLAYTRGALVYIDKLKAWEVTENLGWATSQINSRKWEIPYKWRLGKGLA